MFARAGEKDFLLSFLHSGQRVLEYGSGNSTQEIATLVKEIVSVEHCPEWYEKVVEMNISNAKIILAEPDIKQKDGYADGTLDEFNTYIHTPLQFEKFDVVFIDGRARVECARILNKTATKDALIFMHDFNTNDPTRAHYKEVLNWLKVIDNNGSMFLFKQL